MRKRFLVFAVAVVSMLLLSTPVALAQGYYDPCYDGMLTDADYSYCNPYETHTDLGFANLQECLQHFGPQACERLRLMASGQLTAPLFIDP